MKAEAHLYDIHLTNQKNVADKTCFGDSRACESKLRRSILKFELIDCTELAVLPRSINTEASKFRDDCSKIGHSSLTELTGPGAIAYD